MAANASRPKGDFPKISCAASRKAVGYTVDKTKWTPRDHQVALLLEALEVLPELYYPSHPGFKDAAAGNHPSWQKLLKERERILGRDDVHPFTIPQLMKMVDSMRDIFQGIHWEAVAKFGMANSYSKSVFEFGDERCPQFSHMLFMSNIISIQFLTDFDYFGPKLVKRSGVESIIYPNGRIECVDALSAEERRKLEPRFRDLLHQTQFRRAREQDPEEAKSLDLKIRNIEALLVNLRKDSDDA